MENKFSDIKIVIGLGNPDAGYKNTYHNAGKLMVDYLSKALDFKNSGHGVGFRKKTSSGLFEFRQVDEVVLIKPLNYMNENGNVAKLALKSFGARANSLLIIHDDSDLEMGGYKISFGRGSAGHNGVKSVIEKIGTNDFWRLRIGIRKIASNESNPTTRKKAGDFVLKNITEADKKTMASVFKKSSLEIFGN